MFLIKLPTMTLLLLLVFLSNCSLFNKTKTYPLVSSGDRLEIAAKEGTFLFTELSLSSDDSLEPRLEGQVLNKTGQDWEHVEFVIDVYDQHREILEGAGYYGRYFSFDDFKDNEVKIIGDGKGIRVLGFEHEQISSYHLRLESPFDTKVDSLKMTVKEEKPTTPQKEMKETEGINGHIELGAGATIRNSLSQKRLDSLDEDPETTTRFFPLIRFELNYQEKQKLNRWYIKNEKPTELTAGRSQLTPLGLFDFTVFYAFPEETWKDPYDTKNKRKTTTFQKYGGGVTYSIETIPQKQHLVIGFTHTQEDIEEDSTEEKYSDLGRDLRRNSIFLKYGIRPWQFGYGYIRTDAQGAADSNNGQRFEIDYLKFFSQSLIMVLQGSFQISEFDARHPLFDKTRMVHQFSFSSFLRVAKVSHYQLYGLVYQREDNNIDFFDNTSTILLAGIGWNF